MATIKPYRARKSLARKIRKFDRIASSDWYRRDARGYDELEAFRVNRAEARVLIEYLEMLEK